MEGPDWQQPFILIFEWGMFILGWGIVVTLSLLALIVVAAFIRATVVVIKKRQNKKEANEGQIEELAKRVAENIKANPGSLDDNPPKL